MSCLRRRSVLLGLSSSYWTGEPCLSPHLLGYLGRSSVSTVGLWHRLHAPMRTGWLCTSEGEREEKAIMGGLNWYSS